MALYDEKDLEVFYSNDDEGHIARLRSEPSVSAYGKEREDAINELKVVVRAIKTAEAQKLEFTGHQI